MRGTLIFPADDRDFLQQLEVRGNNGGVDDVETAYVLTGSTYYVPEHLFNCDDPGLYQKAEYNTVNFNELEVASRVYEYYGDRMAVKIVVVVHTHPSGNTTPSDRDEKWGPQIPPMFDRYFDDYEFFHGLHGLGEECDPDPEWMRRPEKTAENEISWHGESRIHKLAVFDSAFNPRPVVVTTAAEWQAQQRRPLPPRRRCDAWRDRDRDRGGGIPDA